MDANHLMENAASLLESWAVSSNAPESNRLDVYIEAANLLPAVQAVVKAHWGYFSAITGLDQPPTGEGESAVRRTGGGAVSFLPGPAVLTLRTSVRYTVTRCWTASAGSLPSATLYERELMEMFGVVLEGRPVSSDLLISDDWPEGIYPLRKSFTGFHENQEEAAGWKPRVNLSFPSARSIRH